MKGKQLKILLTALQELNLLPIERIANKFHAFCKIEFDWNISSYTAMNDYKVEPTIDNESIEIAKNKIQEIIKQIN